MVVGGRRAETRRSRGMDRSGAIRGWPGWGTRRGDRFLPWGAAFFCLGLSTVLAWERRQYASRGTLVSARTMVPRDRGPNARCTDAPGRRARARAGDRAGRPTRRPSRARVAERVDDDRERPSRAERADPADDVAGRPLGRGGVGHAPPGGRRAASREPLQVELAIDRDDGQDEPLVDRRDERLEDPCRARCRAPPRRRSRSSGGRSRSRPWRSGGAYAWTRWATPARRDDVERAGRGGGHGPIVAISAMLGAARHRPRPSTRGDRAAVALRIGARGGTTQERTLDLRFTRPVGRPRAHGRRGGV